MESNLKVPLAQAMESPNEYLIQVVSEKPAWNSGEKDGEILR